MTVRHRGSACPPRSQYVLLVGFQDQDNLGLRYLMAAVNAAGHRAEITTYRSDPSALLQQVQREEPDVLGFSLIFQYMAPDFARVIRTLRQHGVQSHFTMGGHYPSFDYAEVLTRIPELDSVVRFEGEATLVELLNRLASGEDWRSIEGIARLSDGGDVVANPLRDPIAELDTLPWPDRTSIRYESHVLPTASMLGSRGCPWNCSFCSIRPFYEAQGGRLRRLRDPHQVVREMVHLHYTRGIPVFLFQDDDFLATGRRAREWAVSIADGVRAAGLAGKIAFKISCRSDEIRGDLIERLMEGGLTHVYMGIESGDSDSLRNMNKMLDPEKHLRAGEILKRAGLSFDFGFMLLEPYSTFRMVRNNIAFLEAFVGDGWSVAPFCRMLPYAGTPIKESLKAEGRLLGTPFDPDYKFLEPRLDIFYDWMLEAFYRRNFTTDGLCHILRALLFEAHLRLDETNPVSPGERAYLHHLAAVTNGVACYTLRAALDHIEGSSLAQLEADRSFLLGLTAHERTQEARLESEVADYYRLVNSGRGEAPEPRSVGFNESWTFEGDREAAGIGAV